MIRGLTDLTKVSDTLQGVFFDLQLSRLQRYKVPPRMTLNITF